MPLFNRRSKTYHLFYEFAHEVCSFLILWFAWIESLFLRIRYRKTKPLPILKLPGLVLKDIVGMMTVQERIKLALNSKRSKNLVKSFKLVSADYCIYLSRANVGIDIRNEFALLFCDSLTIPKTGVLSNAFEEEEDALTLRQMYPWLKKSDSRVQSLCKMFKNLRDIIPRKSISLYIDVCNLKIEMVEEFLSILEFQNFKQIEIVGGEVNAELLNLMMNREHDNERIVVSGATIPEDFSHKDAFNFTHIHYDDAKWVRIEDLFSLKESDRVQIGQNNFSTSDINLLIKHWIDSDHDMFRSLSIRLRQGAGDEKEIIQDLDVFQTLRFDQRYFLVAAKQPAPSRMQKVLAFHCNYTNIVLETYSPYEEAKRDTQRQAPYHREYDILRILQEKKKLEAELANKVALDELDSLNRQSRSELSDEARETLEELDWLLERTTETGLQRLTLELALRRVMVHNGIFSFRRTR